MKTSARANLDSDEAIGETAVSPPTNNENKYRNLFEATPISLWEEDFSEVKKFLDGLREQGITDFRAYFDTNPEEVLRTIRLVKIKRVNQATLHLYKAPNTEVLLDNLQEIIGPSSHNVIKEQLITIAENGTAFEAEGSNYTLEGEEIDVIIRWLVTPGFEKTYSQIMISIWDITSQKQTEKQLRLQATALEYVANAVVVIDAESKVAWINPAYTKLTGYEPEEIIGKPMNFLAPIVDKEEIYRESGEALAAGKTWRRENVVSLRKDGSLYYNDVTVSAVKDANGQTINYVAVVEDITERKQIEIQLRQRLQEEELLRQIVAINPAPDAFDEGLSAICEKLAHFYDVPSVSFTLLDKTAMLADTLGEYVDPATIRNNITITPLPNLVPLNYLMQQTAVTLIPNVQEAAEFAEIREILQTFKNHSALIIPLAAPTPWQGLLVIDTIEFKSFSQKDIEFMEKVGAHISQILHRVQAEQKLQTQRNFAHQIMSHMGQGLLVLRSDLKIDYCNPAFATLIGYPEEKLLNQHFTKFITEDAQPFFFLTQAERLSQTMVRELKLVRANNKVVDILVTAVPQNSEFSTSGFICVVTDLSAQKKIENALAQARDKALEASELKSEFLANMSHEIRTPLNAVIGMTSLLLDAPLTAEQQDYAQTIRSSGEILLSLINDILDLSKIEAGKLELVKRPFALRACVEEAIDVIASKAAAKGLELNYLIDDNVPDEILSDANRLRQVLVNLLNNAIKFTETGEVVLSVSLKDERETAVDSGAILQFSIKDTGVGIAAENLEKLFKSFSQVDASATRRYGGSGLGLAISKKLVEMMGGEIGVESQYDHGSTFYFTITTTALPSSQPRYTPQALAPLKNKRLLIVDDNQTSCQILRTQTTAWGMLPQTTTSAAEALALLKNGDPFDLAILDMEMPDMDGLTLATEIKNLPVRESLPVVLLTPLGKSAQRTTIPSLAAQLTKPIKQHLLFEALLATVSQTATLTEGIAHKIEFDSQFGHRHPLRILLAEDNQINQKVALRLLKRMGYQADVASDGLEVLEALKAQRYDVVLMDVQMPRLDGVAATEKIRNGWPTNQQPHIIAMTANALSGDREKYLVAGMNDYLSKPVKIQELAAALQKANPLETEQ
ncbi:MAG: response regulator [Ardenticatenaceae bacterium]|nr:response regulator [Ardenticatenaceae bacterium]